MQTSSQWQMIGRVGPAVGSAGMFEVVAPTRVPAEGLRWVCLGTATRIGSAQQVQAQRTQGRRWLLQLAGITTSAELAAASGRFLWAEADGSATAAHPRLEQEVHDCDGKLLGIAAAWSNHGAGDILTVANGNARVDLAFHSTYFTSTEPGQPLTLKMPAAAFSDLWYQG